MKRSTLFEILSFLLMALGFAAIFFDHTDKGQYLILLSFLADIKADLIKLREDQ